VIDDGRWWAVAVVGMTAAATSLSMGSRIRTIHRGMYAWSERSEYGEFKIQQPDGIWTLTDSGQDWTLFSPRFRAYDPSLKHEKAKIYGSEREVKDAAEKLMLNWESL
jgi:hypothetical protein